MKSTWINLVVIFLISATLLSCAHVQIPDTKHCTVRGRLAHGANCSTTISNKQEKMDLNAFVKFLEPDEESGKGGAICTPSEDYRKAKTAIEQACAMLGKKCSLEVIEVLDRITNNVDQIINQGVKMSKIDQIPYKGQSGKHVIELQKALKDKGFDPGPIDGIYGNKTESAVQDFQKSVGLPGGGIIGPKTLEFLGLEVGVVNPVSGKEPITKDLKGKKSRYLHPTFRMMIENRVFAKGIPDAFKKKDLVGCVDLLCQAFLAMGIREVGGNNRGETVGFIQGIIGPYRQNGTGDAWCMSAVQCIVAFVEDYFQVESPLLDSEHCMTVYNHAKKIGLIGKCESGAVWLAQNGTSSAGHTGIVKSATKTKMDTYEGNTGNASIRDGDGFYLKTRDQKQNGNLKTRGFAYIYPNNKLPA